MISYLIVILNTCERVLAGDAAAVGSTNELMKARLVQDERRQHREMSIDVGHFCWFDRCESVG